MTVAYVVVGIIGFVLLYGIGTYNKLVRLRQHVSESWSTIDTELKRRYDLIPNLVETVKGYASHERETLQAVIDARAHAVASTGTPAEQARDENVFVGALRQLFAVVEAYPDLKANQNFLRLQEELTVTEDRIQAARRFYNANVRDLNTRIEVFPSNLIASSFGFKRETFFEIEDTERAVPQVSFVDEG
jgi:LemA protein